MLSLSDTAIRVVLRASLTCRRLKEACDATVASGEFQTDFWRFHLARLALPTERGAYLCTQGVNVNMRV